MQTCSRVEREGRIPDIFCLGRPGFFQRQLQSGLPLQLSTSDGFPPTYQKGSEIPGINEIIKRAEEGSSIIEGKVHFWGPREVNDS